MSEQSGETLTVVPEFCDSEFIYRGWHLYANGEWVRGWREHALMAACGFDPGYGLSRPAFVGEWNRFVRWFAKTYPQGADFKVLPFRELELLTDSGIGR